MSDQEEGRGHHVTTMHAVRHLFETLPADRLLGHTPQQFFDRLDAAQAKVDGVPLGNSRLAHYISLASGERLSQGSGSTVLPSTWAPEVQKAHALSNPHLSSYENLNAIKSYLVDELTAAKAAHQRGDSNAEFEHLGRVAHSMEDSYSQAHMLRDPTRPGDPEAPIKALLNFDSIPGAASNTHAKAFDKVPTDPSNNDPARPADQAGSEALGRVLSSYVNTIDSADPIATHAAFQDAVQPFFQADHLVTFDNKHDPAYQQQLALHYDNEVSLSPVVPDAQERNMSTLPEAMAHPEDSSMGPSTTGSDAVSMQPADAPLASYPTSGTDHGATAAHDGQVTDAPAQPHAGSGNGTSSAADSLAAQINGTHDYPQSSQGAVAGSDAPGNGHRTLDVGSTGSGDAGVAPSAQGSGQQTADAGIAHPTAGVHTDVRNVSDGHGHHHYVYGEGGSTGQTAREHAANPNQPHNWQSQNGADIICPRGTPIYAAFDGSISDKFGVEHGHENDTVQSTHHGNRLIIVGADNQAFYQHLDRIADGVVPGATVHRGELIGYSGIGGGVEHLHFAVQHGDTDGLLHDAAAQASHAETSTPTPESAAAHANDVPAPAGHSTSQHDGETTAANMTSVHHLNPGVEPGPANGRFNTAEDFRHSGNLHSLQLHPEMLHGDGRAGDNAITARHSDGIRSDPGRDDGSAWSNSGRHEDQSAVAANSGSHQNGTAAAPDIQGHGAAPHAGITSDPGHHDASAVSHHAHHGHDPAVQHSGQPETEAVAHTSHDWGTNEAGRLASDPGHHEGGAIAHASDGHQSTGDGRIASDPGRHDGGAISHSSNGHHDSSDGRVTSDPGHHSAAIVSNPGDHNDQGAVASHPGPHHDAAGASHSGHHDSNGHHDGAAASHTHQDHEAAAAHHG